MTPGDAPTDASKPASIYEVHLDSWMRVPEDGNRPLASAEIAPKLAEYAKFLKFTDIELLSLSAQRENEENHVTEYLKQFGFGVTRRGYHSIAENWNKTWASHALDYFSTALPQRRFRHHLLNAESNLTPEGGILPLSHDLVTPDHGSILAQMPGDEWKKMANLRLLFAYMFALPGRKLIFMGTEFGQWNAWNPQMSLDWHLVNPFNRHGQIQYCISELNGIYRSEAALQSQSNSFQWIESSNSDLGTLSFVRKADASGGMVLAVFNFTPEPRHNYQLGVPAKGRWRELFNSDAKQYGGSGQGNLGGVDASPIGRHGRSHSINITLPPLGAVFFKR